jgi:putative transcription factor
MSLRGGDNMAACDMCGKEDLLFITEIEGTRLTVCKNCSSYGKILKKHDIKAPLPQSKGSKRSVPASEEKPEVIQTIKSDAYLLIKKKRESMGPKQEDLARKLAEKESIIHKIESGSYSPSIDLARKLERYLGLSLIEEVEITKMEMKSSDDALTIGDMIKIK